MMKPTLISLDDTQSRVLSCKVFRKNTARSEARRGDFSRKPEGLDLAGQWDTGLSLSNEIGAGNKVGAVVLSQNGLG